MRPPGWFRLMRAGVFASVCVVLSMAGHDMMAARPAPAWAGLIALPVVTAVGYCLADRRRSAWWILLAVEVAQTCLHQWFTWATPSAPGHLVMTMHGGVHHVVGAAPSVRHGASAGLGMLGAHAVAGMLVALWLYAGERALWRALSALGESLLGRTLRALVLLAPADLRTPPRRPAGPCRRDDDTPPVTATLRHVLVRRGPPRNTGVPANALI
ncbi:hypothetical protein [Actinoallomurus sp. CA-150999]|uniref:hypothetical protein n=1 Tax=Actinoallomurus sp. CA-150999 TaxID=3239887 RepID=UPI003D949728